MQPSAARRSLFGKSRVYSTFGESLPPAHRGDGVERRAHSCDDVTQRNVEILLGRLVTNPALRRRFAEEPEAVLREFQDEGYELSAIELDALAATRADAIRSFAESIDRRIRRVDPQSGAGHGR